jgi:enoyl-CoA hydratase/carnithine racemase
MPDFKTIETELRDGVLHAWMNRPKKANALDRTLWFELGELANWADLLPEARVLVLGGRGRHFTAGIDFSLVMDIATMASRLPEGRKQEELRRTILDLQRAFSAFEQCRKPVIASIHGCCYGGGIDLSTACDMRYSTEDASFCVKEVDLAIVADIGTLQRLPPIVGEGIARELAFTGRVFDGKEAKEMGLVNAVFETQDGLDRGVAEIAQGIASKSPLAVRGIKRVMNHSRGRTVEEGLDYVATWNASMLLSADTQEAMRAALEKRAASFPD